MSALSYQIETTPFLYSTFSTEDEVKEACRVASSHRLAVPGWMFFELFRAGKDGDTTNYEISKLTLAFCNVTGVPVGCAMIFKGWGDTNAGCFVRDSHRRQGIGSRLVEELLAGEATPVRIHDGIDGSKNFWRSMGANDMDYIRDR